MSMRSITTWSFKSEEPLLLARRFADLEGTALLYSGGDLDSAQGSFLCLFPEKKIALQAHPTCWEQLQAELGAFDKDAPPIPRWVGYLGYEMGCFADPDRSFPYYTPSTPDCCFYLPTVVIHYDHGSRKATLYARDRHISLERAEPPASLYGPFTLIYSSDTLHSYLDKIAQAKAWILEGEIYQVNLSQEMHLEGKTAPFEHFERLLHLNPAPFMAYINCGAFTIVSSSPERFLYKRGSTLETRPIKGTAPRGNTPEEDARNRATLLASEKERAELLMITDLMRSDVGKVARIGSVAVKEIWRCEAYANVFHLLSIVEGKISLDTEPVTLVRQLFPGGSVTGCPKLRAMEAIATLERRPRGIYTGSIGYFAANGDFDFNIAIRTLIVHPTCIQIQLGGAIVIDSDPVGEFTETLQKGHSLFKVLATACREEETHGHCLL